MKNKDKKTYYKDTDLLIQIGENLRKVRESKGISQEALANDFGLDYTQINRMELGKVNFSISNLYRLAKALGVDAKKLLP